VLLLGGLGAAVSGPLRGDAGGGELAVVLAAASLADVLPRIEPDARVSYAGSNALAEQVRQGAPFDVFLSASPLDTRGLHREGLVRAPVAFASNRLVVVVPRGNPARVASVRDLARPGLRLVVAGPHVPVGRYTREALRRLGLSGALAVVVSLEPDVKGIVGKVVLGEADAGVVYATDAAAAGDAVRTVPVPAEAQPSIRYELAVSARPVDGAAAQELVERVLGERGRRELRRAGFGPP
jgi:molybdate transport system substrate-binding protein